MYGQVIIGPPGSGKSTYCHGLYQFLSAIGRKLCIINLDPANDHLPYPVALDIRDFITIEEIMEELNLGPNGGLLFAMENLKQELIEDFISKVNDLKMDNYLIFDCPGQVELFTHDNTLHKIFKKLTSDDLRLCVVLLVDSIYLTSPSQYVSILLLSLRSMLQMSLPQINVISKIDKLKSYGSLPFKLDYYTDVQDLSFLTPHLEKESNSVLGKKYVKLTQTLSEIIEDFNLVSFQVLSVENKRCMIDLLRVVDKALGYHAGKNEIGGDSLWTDAVRNDNNIEEIDIHERWIDMKETYDEMESKQDEELRQSISGLPESEDDEYERQLRQFNSQM